jgi:hypothetical protein
LGHYVLHKTNFAVQSNGLTGGESFPAMRAVLFWLLIAALSAALTLFLIPFGQGLVIAVVWLAEIRDPLAWAMVLLMGVPFSLAPFVVVTVIFHGTYRSLRGRG